MNLKTGRLISIGWRGFIGLLGWLGLIASSLAAERPNILLIMADDMGYSDIGAYGGEIDTPNLDRLAAEGLRMSHFRATPMCVTSRVALLSGMPYHAAGGLRHDRVKPLPESLREQGYRTVIAGKWHASNGHPLAHGFFDRFHGFLGGMTDCYAGGNDWFLENEPFRDFGASFDATTVITDYSIEQMDAALKHERPFFMFVAYNAPHHPLQARQETVQKYIGRYMEGFEAVRERRLARQRAMGLIAEDLVAASAEIEVRPWTQMTDFRRTVEDARMAAYAAMVDEMDQGIGRLLDALEVRGALDNTVVIFMSDNGGYYNHGNIETDHLQKPWLPGSNVTVSSGWAWVQNTPFRFYKQTSHEGGLAVPFIIRWPTELEAPAGSISDIPADITDIYPTLLELTGGHYSERWEGKVLKPLRGKSFLSALKNGEPFDAPIRFHAFLNPRFHESRALIDGDHKVVAMHNGPWALYDLKSDRGELVDLSASKPELRERMVKQWHALAREYQVPPAARGLEVEEQQNWGWQRFLMFAPALESLTPDNSTRVPPGLDHFEMQFRHKLDFSQSGNRRIRLFKQSDEANPVWDVSLDAKHPSQGQQILRVDNLRPLEPNTHYYFLIDPGAFRVGGKPVGPINDGAFWWRFKTEADPSF